MKHRSIIYRIISVIVARILRKSNRRINNHNVYKIDIVKTYKTSEKAQQYLKQSRLITAPNDGLCGINFSEFPKSSFTVDDSLIRFITPFSDVKQKSDSFMPSLAVHKRSVCVSISRSIQKCRRSRNEASLALTKRVVNVK